MESLWLEKDSGPFDNDRITLIKYKSVKLLKDIVVYQVRGQ